MAIFFALTTGLLAGVLFMSFMFHHLIETDEDFRNMILEEVTV